MKKAIVYLTSILLAVAASMPTGAQTTPAQFKQKVDTSIRQKTAAGSIKKEAVAGRFDEVADLFCSQFQNGVNRSGDTARLGGSFDHVYLHSNVDPATGKAFIVEHEFGDYSTGYFQNAWGTSIGSNGPNNNAEVEIDSGVTLYANGWHSGGNITMNLVPDSMSIFAAGDRDFFKLKYGLTSTPQPIALYLNSGFHVDNPLCSAVIGSPLADVPFADADYAQFSVNMVDPGGFSGDMHMNLDVDNGFILQNGVSTLNFSEGNFVSRYNNGASGHTVIEQHASSITLTVESAVGITNFKVFPGGIEINGVPEYADNAAAIADGLAVNRVYVTPDGTLKKVFTP